MLLLAKAEDHDRLNMTLIGPPKIDRPSLIDERAGFVPPPWWKGDDYASRSGMTAMMTLKR
jgi:flavin-dependent dehydrogenase